MKKYIYAAIIILLTSSPSSAKTASPFALPPDAGSAAYETGSFSYLVNPVFTDSSMQPDIAYRYISTEGNSTHHALVNLFGFALGYSWYGYAYGPAVSSPVESRTSMYSISRGFLFGGVFGFGIGYSAGFSSIDEFDEYSGWNAGLLYRPFSFISLGMSVRDISGELGGRDLHAAQTWSIAIRPFGEWLTLSADYVTRSAFSDEPTWKFSGKIELWQRASLFASGDTSRNFTAGITIPLNTRFADPVNFTADFYKSYNSDIPGFYSAGAAVKFRRGSGATLPVADNILYIKLAEKYGENEGSGFFVKGSPDLLVLINGIMKAADDPSIDGAVIEINELGMGLAQMQELRRSINYFRSRGKKVHAMMNVSGNRQYFVASCADVIYFTPNTEFSITGLKANVYFFKGLMDKAGVEFQSVRRGDYKSFNEPFTRTGMSPEARSNLNELLTDLNEQFISALTERKPVTREKIKEMFETGLYTPEEAKSRGFIDEVMYCDDMKDTLARDNIFVKFEDYADEETVSGSWGNEEAIAIIYVKGNIVTGDADGGGLNPATGDEGYRKMLESVFRDSNVKGVVIRIDSGGGSAVASDFMWKSLLYLKKRYPKPVVFSFGNTAASGGYYIACTGDRIFAENGTVTGSIGVIAGKVSVKELYAKLGISKESITLSEFADIFTESRPMTDNEYRLLDKQTGLIYDRFTQKVIEARKIAAAEIEKIAGGRVHTGLGARGKGLVDEEGGVYAAVAFCRTLCGIEGRFRILQVPDNSGLFRDLTAMTPAAASVDVMDIFFRNLQALTMMDGQVLYLQPYFIEIE